MEHCQASRTQGNNHQQVILKRNDGPGPTTATFSLPAGPNHQRVTLTRKIQSDRTIGPDHQHVVLRRSKGSGQTVPNEQILEPSQGNNDQTAYIPQIDAQGVLSSPSQNPTTSETVDHLNGKPKPAEVYIFNHEDFKSIDKNRRGSSEDVKALRTTFEKLECNVYEIKNPTSSMVKKEVQELSTKNFEHHSALVVVILSHGQRMEQIETCDHKMYSLDDDVLFPLFKNQTLRDKPIILIVQACKGTMKADAIPNTDFCAPRHYIKCYSTTEGFFSYRDEETGSIYIQTLCKVMDQDGLTKDFRRIIEDVNARVAEESSSGSYKQVPATTNTMYQPYCFGDYVSKK